LLYGEHGAVEVGRHRLGTTEPGRDLPSPEIRFDELRGEPVVYATARQERTFLPDSGDCPLCPTRPGGPVTEIPTPSYEIAVFENRFPALAAPRGAAEVVVYTDRHDGSFAALPAARARLLMEVWRERCEELLARPEVEYVMAFENRGVEVGTTLHHPHGQIYAYPFLPPVARREREADVRLGGCAVCALCARELGGGGPRVVLASSAVVAYVPYAARWPYEVHVVAVEHRPGLAACAPAELDAFANVLQAVARGYDALFDRPFPYVMVLHQDGHLHAEFYPPLRTAQKLKFIAGSELGAGTFAVDVLPERSAELLRDAIARG
jgi:UDPglucose--hexose-1-phosphate uridylyltransferase